MTPRQVSGRQVAVAANNGEIGGGEVMLLAIADSLRRLGRRVSVVGPAGSEVVDAAEDEGHETIEIPGGGRFEYVRGLRRWDRRERAGVLWCNGLVPALATAGHRDRIVHLHRMPEGAQKPAAALARMGARQTLAPSHTMARTLKGSRALQNWTADLPLIPGRPASTRARIGFLGRLGADKGVPDLARAIRLMESDVELVIGGEPRFVDDQSQGLVEEALAAVDEVTTYLGWVPREDFFSQVDIAVFPSVWTEPFGLVAAEAMAFGVPVVVSDAGALPEVVGPEHPWVAPAGDPAGLARVLERVLDEGDAARDRVVQAARQRWEEHFSPAAGDRRVAELIRALGI